jgi:hypothetical protein
MLRGEFHEEDIRDAISELEASLEEEMTAAVDDIDTLVAEEAQQNHSFQNRTGDLDANILPGRATGSFAAGTLEGEVVGDTEYGEYVEAMDDFAFLDPALERTEAQQEHVLEQHLATAVRRSDGWT